MDMYSSIKKYAELVKFEHTIFAAPFAYVALVLTGRPLINPRPWVWITLSMVGARTAGMALNRIVDHRLDALNPRTAVRALPQGEVSMIQAWGLVTGAVAALSVAAWELNPGCLVGVPVVVGLMTLYPFMKRWSWLTHEVLGAVYVCIPLAVWWGVTDRMTAASLVLGVAMGSWVAGFDILYTLQDYESDVKNGLHSIPARFGPAVALTISSWHHVVTMMGLASIGWLLHLGMAYGVGIGVVGALLWYEHRLLSPGDYSRLDRAFFTVNGFISVWLFVVVLISRAV